MRELFYGLTVDGKPILVPDADVTLTCTDLDSAESGRDESGVMHRIVVRRGVRSWEVSYALLTAPEYGYMEALFAGKDRFTVVFRDAGGVRVSCTAYRSKHSITIHNAKTGIFKNYTFSIVEC